MKIASINLHCHKENDELAKLGKIAKYILDNDIDVILLQEVCQLIDDPYIEKNLKNDNNGYLLAKLTNYNYEFKGFKLGFGIYEEGLGILSKKPINDLKLVNLTKTESFNSWLRRCALIYELDGIRFIDVHLGWSNIEEPIEYQLDKLIPYFNENTVLAGDFNYPDNTFVINEIKKHLKSSHDIFNLDSKLNPTFHNELDSKMECDNRMIDFIFVGDNIKPMNFEIKFKEERDYVSDHSLLELEIEG